MIKENSLRAYLNYFSGPERSRGYDLYHDGAVFDVNHDNKEKFITSQVSDDIVYHVSLKYLNEWSIASSKCSCPSPSFCQHEVALLEYLVRQKDVKRMSLKHSRPLPSKPLPQPNAKPSIQSNEYNKLDVSDFAKFQSTISRICDLYHYSEREDYSCRIIDEHTLHFYAIERSRFYYYGKKEDIYDKVSVELKYTTKSFKVKCHRCSRNLKNLCTHVAFALDGVMDSPIFREIISGSFNFSDMVAESATSFSISSAFLIENFVLVINKNTLGLLALNKNVPLGQDWTNLLSSVVGMSSNLTTFESEFLDEKQSKQEDRLENAMVWPSRGVEYLNIMPRIIQGKLNKDGSKLTSYIKEVEFPSAASHDLASLYLKFTNIHQLSLQYDVQIILGKLSDFIDDNFNLFNSWIHYILEADPYEHDIKKRDLTLITFSKIKADLKIEVTKDKKNFWIKIYVKLAEQLISINDITFITPLFLHYKGRAYLYANVDVFLFLNKNKDQGDMLIDSTPNPAIAQLLYKLAEKFEVSPLPEFLQAKSVELIDAERKLIIRESGDILTFEPILKFSNGNEYNILSPHADLDIKDDYLVAYTLNDVEVEGFIEFMDKSHDHFSTERYDYEFYFLEIEDALKGNWFLDFFENCRSEGIELFGEDLLQNFKFNKNKAIISNSVKSGIDWFDVNVDMSFGKEKVPTARWIEAIRNKEKYVQLKDGTLGVLPELWLSRLRKLAHMAEVNKGNLQISKLSFNVVEELFEELGEEEILEEIRVKKEKLKEFESIKKLPIPKTVKAKMRDYQKKGYHWLKFLDEFNFGGCLADDMGLGKTLQIITFLADQKKQKRGTSLIVMPRSLLFNWAAEIEKFCTYLKYYTHHGPKRNSEEVDFSKYDLIFSTYDTVTIDIEMIRDFKFNYCVLDESQAIKNPNSKRYKAMRLINAHNRLVMTGTPIENNTFDLFGQFSFINPGLFVSQASFKKNFAVPIDSRGNQEAADLLRKIVYPFLLRRTKEQVAKDLPDRTESVLMCTMDETQRKMYDELKLSIKQDIDDKIKEDGLNKSKFKILEGLLRLRQICNSPLLISPQLNGRRAQSAKIDMLLEHILEVTQSHKALVFSQFVSMLAIIKNELDKRKIKYAYLDGSTRDRAGSVDDFESDDDCKIFLLSLKAGNTGLNLVSAAYVYIVDPWWNPAVEAQAIDRTHRIGQTKNVFAYKLICKDTIEEKILKLQEKKKKIASDIIRTDESILKSLTKDSLMALFE